MGLPNLSDKDQGKAHVGNTLLLTSAKIVRFCNARSIPVSLENPRRSRLWWTPVMLRLKRSASLVHMDFCRFGTEWQKPTTFAVWGTSSLDPLGMQCAPRAHLCSTSHCRYRRLESTAPGGRHWTAIAEPYPKELCRLYASCATKAYETKAFCQN